MNAPPAAVEQLTHLFRNASPALAAALRIEIRPVSDGRPEQGRRADGAIRFCVPQITLAALR
jgi:hypothetical protein